MAGADQLTTFSTGGVNDHSCCNLAFAWRKPPGGNSPTCRH